VFINHFVETEPNPDLRYC